MRRLRLLCASLALLLATPVFASKVVDNQSALFNVKHWKTKNGVRVYFHPQDDLPMVDVAIAFDAGSARDGNKPGLASLLVNSLDQGAASWDASQLAQQFESVGALFSHELTKDMARLQMRSLVKKDRLQPALDAFVTVLSQPTFPNDALERNKAQALNTIAKREKSAGDLASQRFTEMLYAGHPYAHSAVGDAISIKKITRADVQHFYRRYYVAENAVIAIVGKLSLKQAQGMATKIASHLVHGEAATALPAPKPLDKPQSQKLAFDGSQTAFRIGCLAIARRDPDYFALALGSKVLGGPPTISRLFQRVRVEKGLTYRIYTDLVLRSQTGVFVVKLQTRNAKASEAKALTLKLLDAFVKEGPTATELQKAKEHFLGRFPLRFASNASMLSSLVNIGFYGSSLNHLDDFQARFSALTAEDVRSAFSRRLANPACAVVQVGR